MNKNGTIFDALGIIIFTLILVVVIISFFIAHKELDDALANTPLSSTNKNFNESRQVIADQAAKYPAFMDFVFVFLLFGMWIVVMISAIILGSNPAFLVIYFILSFVLIITALVLEFAMSNFIENSIIFPYALSFPMMVWIIDRFITFALFFIVSVAVALYMKRGKG